MSPDFHSSSPGSSGVSDRRTAPSRLPAGAERLFGRDDELLRLEAAWNDPRIHVVTLVAWGGVGKTALVARWVARLAARDHDGADYFDWSFYSQGTRDTATASGDPFVDAALRFFGDEATADSAKSPWDKGARLAKVVAERRMLLVLDGLEPLQHPPGPLAGELKDPAISALLKGLAGRNPGLCLVTTRESIHDLASYRGSTAPERKLEHLSTLAGVELLKHHGVHGSTGDLNQLVEDVGGHALTLNLFGRYLARAHSGDVRRRDRVQLVKADRDRHASHVMEAYETWLSAGGEDGLRQLAILRLLGLFDRPADAGCLAALRQEPVIAGLTEPLIDLDDETWNVAVRDLIDCGLLVAPTPSPAGAGEGWGEGGTHDAHPLVREHFGRQLREGHPNAWRAAHSRLFDYLKETTEHRPDTLVGLQPLYQAVVHGCLAGRHEEARTEVYYDRILRGTSFHSTRKLGSFGADLGAVACFFASPWSSVVPSLSEVVQTWLLHMAATHLSALGRLAEALEPTRGVLAADVERARWGEAATSASNLSELELTLGDMAGALRHGEQAVVFADRASDAVVQMALRTTHADALQVAGRRAEALVLFREAESMQAEQQPDYPLLYSLRGFRYCDLLLAGPERTAAGGRHAAGASEACLDVEHRAAQALRASEADKGTPMLDFAHDHLSLGRARLCRAILDSSALEESAPEIEQAVDGLRRAHQLRYLPLGLLTRAWLRSAQGDTGAARADLDEALEIAERGPMPLHLADVHLYRGRLYDRAALAEARRLIDKHGYGRRREELEDAEEASRSWPDPPPSRSPEMPDLEKRFRVALSFAGEHRPFVEQVAERLASSVGKQRVLYDAYYEAEFARVDLDTYLQRLYHDESDLIAIFLSADYERKEWCGLEWRAIRDLIKKRKGDSVMPLRFDATEIPGLFSGDGYVSIRDREPEVIADLILQRLGLPVPAAPPPSPRPARAETSPASRPKSAALIL